MVIFSLMIRQCLYRSDFLMRDKNLQIVYLSQIFTQVKDKLKNRFECLIFLIQIFVFSILQFVLKQLIFENQITLQNVINLITQNGVLLLLNTNDCFILIENLVLHTCIDFYGFNSDDQSMSITLLQFLSCVMLIIFCHYLVITQNLAKKNELNNYLLTNHDWEDVVAIIRLNSNDELAYDQYFGFKNKRINSLKLSVVRSNSRAPTMRSTDLPLREFAMHFCIAIREEILQFLISNVNEDNIINAPNINSSQNQIIVQRTFKCQNQQIFMTFNKNHNVLIFKVQQFKIDVVLDIAKKNTKKISSKNKSGDPKFLNEIKNDINQSQQKEGQFSTKKQSRKRKKNMEKMQSHTNHSKIQISHHKGIRSNTDSIGYSSNKDSKNSLSFSKKSISSASKKSLTFAQLVGEQRQNAPKSIKPEQLENSNDLILKCFDNSYSSEEQSSKGIIQKQVSKQKIQSLMKIQKIIQRSLDQENLMDPEMNFKDVNNTQSLDQSLTISNQNNYVQLFNLHVRQILAEEISQAEQIFRKKSVNNSSSYNSQHNSTSSYSQESMIRDIYNKKLQKLQSQLKNNKIFMSMVIHDMRNPTTAIQFGVSETIQMLQNQRIKIESLKKNRQRKFINLKQKLTRVITHSSISLGSQSIQLDESKFYELNQIDENQAFQSESNDLEERKMDQNRFKRKKQIRPRGGSLNINIGQQPIQIQRPIIAMNSMMNQYRSIYFGRSQPMLNHGTFLQNIVQNSGLDNSLNNLSNQAEDEQIVEEQPPRLNRLDRLDVYSFAHRNHPLLLQSQDFALQLEQIQDINQICDIDQSDCDENSEPVQMRSVKAKEHKMGWIDFEHFMQQIIFRLDISNINEEKVREIQQSLDRIEELARENQIRERVVFVQSPQVNHMDRATQSEFQNDSLLEFQLEHFSNAAARRGSEQPPNNQNFSRRAEAPQSGEIFSMLKDNGQQCDIQDNQNQELLFQNKLLNQQNQDFKSKNSQLQFANYNLQQVLELYEAQLIEMQDQDFFENNFLEKVEKFLQNAMFSATMLNNLINDMMDLAKMESGTFIFHDDYFDLVEIIQNSFQVLRFLAEKKKIKMSYKIIDERDKSLRIPSASQMSSNFQSASAGSSNYFDSNNASHDPNEILGMTHSSNQVANLQNLFCQLYGDQNRYLQILINFLSNAINYTKKEGRIQVRVILLEEQKYKPKSMFHSQNDKKSSFKSLESNEGFNNLFNPTKFHELSFIQDLKQLTEINYSLDNLEDNNISKFIKFRIEIQDSGVGIKKEDIEKLFMDFSRLDKDMNNKGTGLGLSICKKMIEKMGGKVEVDSTVDVGTTFKVTLQAKSIPVQKIKVKQENSISNNQSFYLSNPISEQEEQFRNSQDEHQRRLSHQIQDRDNLNQTNSNQINSSSFTISDNNIQQEPSSQGSFNNMKQSSQGSFISFMKIQQDDHRAMREKMAFSFGQQKNSEKSYTSSSQKQQIISHQEEQKVQIEEEQKIPSDMKMNLFSQSSFQEEKEFRCLVANDCDFQMMQIVHILKKNGVHVTEAINGMEAVNIIQRTQNLKIDFVILDLQMPIMNGYDAAKQIIAHYNELLQLDHRVPTRHQELLNLYDEMGQIPLMVALSAHVNEEIRKKCLSIGFNIVLETPLTIKKVEDEILKHLRNDKKISKNVFSMLRANNSSQKIGQLDQLPEQEDEDSSGESFYVEDQ